MTGRFVNMVGSVIVVVAPEMTERSLLARAARAVLPGTRTVHAHDAEEAAQIADRLHAAAVLVGHDESLHGIEAMVQRMAGTRSRPAVVSILLSKAGRKGIRRMLDRTVPLFPAVDHVATADPETGAEGVAPDVSEPHPERPGEQRFAELLMKLSPRERQVLDLIIAGKSNAEVAGMLDLSAKTIATYRSRFMQKLRVDSLPGLVKLSIRAGLTQL